jgi:hypothetical protein
MSAPSGPGLLPLPSFCLPREDTSAASRSFFNFTMSATARAVPLIRRAMSSKMPLQIAKIKAFIQ